MRTTSPTAHNYSSTAPIAGAGSGFTRAIPQLVKFGGWSVPHLMRGRSSAPGTRDFTLIAVTLASREIATGRRPPPPLPRHKVKAEGTVSHPDP